MTSPRVAPATTARQQGHAREPGRGGPLLDLS